jgi:trehalose 6-phosphate phosphatase
LRVDAGWDKGCAVKWLLDKHGISTENDKYVPIYIGDDVTDEDGFRAVNTYKNGMSILVGNRLDTSAQARLGSPSDVSEFLSLLLVDD